MSDEAAEEHEIFDINDFTTASDWERFIVQIEAIINEWKLINTQADGERFEINDFSKSIWDEKSDNIQFADTSFTITRHYLTKNLSSSFSSQENELIIKDPMSLPPRSMADLLSVANDFKGNVPKLAEWYGLSDFLVIRPTRTSDLISTESKANILLSSACIAINNTGCHLPIFIQLQQNTRDMFVGVCEGSSLKTYFQVTHFAYLPTQFSNLNGLLEIFKSKLV
jgi:Rab3 GTPase-activating protein catalytic subunit